MGCATSNLPADDSPAVSLCRDRCTLLDHALSHRFTFAQSHAAYLLSLKSLGLSLQRFFADQHHLSPSSPTLNLPPRRKGQSSPPDHHLRLPSDSDSDSSSFHLHHNHENPKMNLNFMKNQTTPSVVHTQVPSVPETLYTGTFFDPIDANYTQFLNFASEPVIPEAVVEHSVSKVSSSPPPPPPPPVASNSTWEFFNPFDSVESFYLDNTPGLLDSKEVREAEGIPDLEDEDEEVVKEIHGDQRLVGGGKTGNQLNSAAPKNVQELKKKKKSDTETRGSRGFRGDMEVVNEIQVQFDRASDCGNELTKFLEVGKLPYKGKHSSNKGKDSIFHRPN